MRGVPNRVFFKGGYMAVSFTFLLHMPALVCVHLIGARDRHQSKLQ